MKLIIAGGRNFTDSQGLRDFLNKLTLRDKVLPWPDKIEIVSGGARGADKVGEDIAKALGMKITVFPAEWDKYGRSAGYIRNKEMANYADVLVACWDGESKGTKHMIDLATKLGMPVYILKYEEKNNV